jgi:hypothetical protein
MDIEITKPNLTSYQKDFLYNNSRFTITEASTKVGKTFSHIWWIFERAHESWNKEGYNHWWVAPVYSQTKIAFKRLRTKLGPTGVYKINESNLTITCPNGSVIHFKSADKPDNLFGEDVYSIVFDEAPRAKVDAFYALRSTITATKGEMKLIGNFGGLANWMHQLKDKAKTDKEYAYFKITAWDAVNEGILDESEIIQAQKDLPTKIFKQLYLAEQEESDSQLCSYEKIKDLWTNSFVPKGEMYLSCDIAMLGSDKFVIFVWSGLRIVDYLIKDKTDGKEIENIIKSVAEKYNIPRSHIVYDADGVGGYLSSYLEGAIAFHNGSKAKNGNYKNLKNECGYKLAEKINANQIYINCDIQKELVIKELECLQSDMLDNEGKIQLMSKKKIKEIISHSPDILDALLLRMYFELVPNAELCLA